MQAATTTDRVQDRLWDLASDIERSADRGTFTAEEVRQYAARLEAMAKALDAGGTDAAA